MHGKRDIFVKIRFEWDDVYMREFIVTVPNVLSDDEICVILKREHKELDKNETNGYGTEKADGKQAEIFLDYMTSQYGWSFKEVTYDVNVALD